MSGSILLLVYYSVYYTLTRYLNVKLSVKVCPTVQELMEFILSLSIAKDIKIDVGYFFARLSIDRITPGLFCLVSG